MIHVTIYQNKNKECVGFLTDGHAGFDEEGKDCLLYTSPSPRD